MKIIKIHLAHLRNEAHYQFLILFRDLLIAFPFIFNLTRELYNQFILLLDRESQLVDAERGSVLSKALAKADKQVDKIVVGINSIINAGLHHYNQAVQEAAETLKARMKVFGNIKGKPYEEESAAVKLLITDLNGKYRPLTDLLGLREWVDQLELAENEFEQIFKQRNTELAEKPDFNLRQVRKEIDAVYQQIIEFIDAAAIANPSPDFDAFIRELNEEIEYAIDHSHRRVKKDLGAGDHTVIEPVDMQIYTGKPVIVIPTVHYCEEGKPTVELIFAVDFNVTYRNNIEVGTADIIVHGKGKYKGKKTVTFSIIKNV
jgi:hypothetical protein